MKMKSMFLRSSFLPVSRLLAFLVLASLAGTVAHGAVPWLHVEGNQIKDSQNNPVTLRGVSVLPVEHNNEFTGGVRKPISEMLNWQADAALGWNSRVVRIQATTSKVSDPAAAFAATIDPYVQMCVTKGLYAIVDLHFVSDYGGTSGVPQSYVLDFWNYVAPKYANTPNVIFEVFNEPINPDNWTTWKNYIQPVINAIRAVAPNNIILVGGPQWSTRVNQAAADPLTGNNLVYVYHIYPNQGDASATNLDAKFGNAANTIPVAVTEFGWNQTAAYSDTITRGSTSGWGQPFRTYIDARPHISWSGYIFDNYWKPQYFDTSWNLLSGSDQGAFMQQWLLEKKDSNQPQGVSGSATGTFPDVPLNLAATGGNGQVSLSWWDATGATSYNVKRSTTSGGPYTTIANGVTTASYTDYTATNGTTYYYVVSSVGSQESPNSYQTSDMPSSTVVIVDNTSATLTGSWTTSTGTPGFYGSNYYHDGNTGSTGGKSARFSPSLPVTGSYRVSVRYPAAMNRATNTPIDVNHAGGTATFSVNQQHDSNVWVPLGTFNFNAGTAGNVLTRNDGGNGYVIADAVKFALTDSGGGCSASTTSVSSIVVTTVNVGGGNKKGQATVTVVNNCGSPVANATVTGDFTGKISQSGVSAVTNSSGVAVLQTTDSAKGTVTVTFCVTNVTHASLTYNSAANVETCDSN